MQQSRSFDTKKLVEA
jgi:hypothetical protein